MCRSALFSGGRHKQDTVPAFICVHSNKPGNTASAYTVTFDFLSMPLSLHAIQFLAQVFGY
jgi:hypothetical protein